METVFEAIHATAEGQLPDIVGLTPDPANGVSPSDALFADPLLGHGGPMMTELSAVAWMSILYGADIATLDQRSVANWSKSPTIWKHRRDQAC